MGFIIPAISLVGLIGPAICQTSPPLAQPSIGEQVRVDSFQSSKRSDNFGIANFIISNVTEKVLNSIELPGGALREASHGEAGPIRAQENFLNTPHPLLGNWRENSPRPTDIDD
jgi:hypothetical protein